VGTRLLSLATDPAAGQRLGRVAIQSRTGAGPGSAGWVRALEEQLASGALRARLYVVDGQPVGFVSWLPGGLVGLTVELLYAEPVPSHGEAYRQILLALEEEAGPVAFVPGPLAGVAPDAEEGLMRSLGFRRYGRSEMVLEVDGVADAPPAAGGERIRPVVRNDLAPLADLHRRAYRDSFDRYLFVELSDDHEDALREVREILDGRWGAFHPSGSWVGERDRGAVGAVLSVHRRTGALIADVMVDPEYRGRGVGRRLLSTAVRALQHAGEQRIYLNVTEGNERAIRLYWGLGFVRTLGPTQDWYNARRIPVPPSPTA